MTCFIKSEPHRHQLIEIETPAALMNKDRNPTGSHLIVKKKKKKDRHPTSVLKDKCGIIPSIKRPEPNRQKDDQNTETPLATIHFQVIKPN